MSNATQGHGGSYAIGESGEHTLVGRTEDHPEGNRPRDKELPPPAQAKRSGKSKPVPAADQSPENSEGAK